MKNIRVLLVEDEPIIAADLEDRLLAMGYEVAQQCSSGEEAIRHIEQENIDIVLMDIQLEGALDGIQTAQKIAAKRTLPIIFLTSNNDDATFTRAKRVNPAAFLSKPYRGKDLRHAIELAISNAQLLPASTDQGDTYWFQDRLFLKVKDRMVRVFLSEILWFEANDYYCKLVTKEKEILITQTLKQMGEALSKIPGFMRVHRSFIVNVAQIEEIGDAFLSIQKRQIPINKSSKDELMSMLHKL